jgi:hypothetical protein
MFPPHSRDAVSIIVLRRGADAWLENFLVGGKDYKALPFSSVRFQQLEFQQVVVLKKCCSYKMTSTLSFLSNCSAEMFHLVMS